MNGDAPKSSPENQLNRLTKLMGEEALELLTTNGSKLIESIGMTAVRAVILDVLSGKNLRDSTELLTRSRLAVLNSAMVKMFLEGETEEPGFIQRLPEIAERILRAKKLSRAERWIALWSLGLTDKASQNVLRDDASLLESYREHYQEICADAVNKAIDHYGVMAGNIHIDGDLRASLNWQFMVYMLAAVGAQTLTIRGSEKSTYGKLFEKLILGSLLTILGFTYTGKPEGVTYTKEFWLSSQGNKRESDATALWEPGKGVRFDIGFIGRGNSEISLDKVTRFEREITLERVMHLTK